MVDLLPTEWEKRAQGFDAPDLIETKHALSLEYKCQPPMGHVAAVPEKPGW